MKTLLLGVALHALCLISSFGAVDASEAPQLINRVNTVAAERDASKALALLNEIQTIRIDRFGGGAGPWDRVYFTRLALTAFKPFLSWDREAGQIPANPSSKIQGWLRTSVDSEADLADMLSSTDPVARLIGCEKLLVADKVPVGLIKPLQSIAQADDYFLVTDKVFTAPLREKAIEILTRVGADHPQEDYGALSSESLQWLGKRYTERVDDPSDQNGIEHAVLALHPLTASIKDAQKKLKDAKTKKEQAAVFASLATSGTNKLKPIVSESTDSSILTRSNESQMASVSPASHDLPRTVYLILGVVVGIGLLWLLWKTFTR